jgi:hypothetical protein
VGVHERMKGGRRQAHLPCPVRSYWLHWSTAFPLPTSCSLTSSYHPLNGRRSRRLGRNQEMMGWQQTWRVFRCHDSIPLAQSPVAVIIIILPPLQFITLIDIAGPPIFASVNVHAWSGHRNDRWNLLKGRVPSQKLLALVVVGGFGIRSASTASVTTNSLFRSSYFLVYRGP